MDMSFSRWGRWRCRLLPLSAMLAALSVSFSTVGQEIGYRDFGNTVDSHPIPVDPYEELPGIEKWLPVEEFAEETREALTPAVSMSSIMNIQHDNTPKHLYILPNNALHLWRISISNGSAGNWGMPPANYLDARTLSFPTP